MTTLSFKAKDDLKQILTLLAERKGINVSAFIKLLLTEALNKELSRLTENGITLAEELTILESDMNNEVSGPFTTVSQLNKSLTK